MTVSELSARRALKAVVSHYHQPTRQQTTLQLADLTTIKNMERRKQAAPGVSVVVFLAVFPHYTINGTANT
jgi:hypothetical protein